MGTPLRRIAGPGLQGIASPVGGPHGRCGERVDVPVSEWKIHCDSKYRKYGTVGTEYLGRVHSIQIGLSSLAPSIDCEKCHIISVSIRSLNHPPWATENPRHIRHEATGYSKIRRTSQANCKICDFYPERAAFLTGHFGAEQDLRLVLSPWAISKASWREDDGQFPPCHVSRENEPGESSPSRPWDYGRIALVDHADITRPMRGDEEAMVVVVTVVRLYRVVYSSHEPRASNRS